MPVPAVIAKIASGAKKANQARKQLKKAQAVADTVSNNEQGGPNITKIIMITAFVGPVVLIIFLGAIFTIIFQEGGYSVNIARAFGDEGTSTSGVQGATNYLEWAIKIANDDSHGYSQCNRTGPDYDCSSLVWYSLVEGAGISPEALGGYAFATGTMPGTLTKVGFKEHPYTGLDDLKPGDILLMDGHTGMYVGDGNTVEAHGPEGGGVCGMAGDQTGHEIDVGPNRSNWTSYFRLES